SPTALLTGGYAQGSTQIASIDIRSGTPTVEWTGDEHVSVGTLVGVAGVSASANGEVMAAVHESFATAPDIWITTSGTNRQLTHFNTSVLSALGRAVSVKWKSDSFNV